MKYWNNKFGIAALVLLVIAVVHFSNNVSTDQASMVTFPDFDTEVNEADSQDINSLKDFNDAIVNIAEKTNPTVVTVFTQKTVNVRQMNPFFPFFGEDPRRERQIPREGMGSGVIVSEEGYILTNNHVIAEADTVYVRTYDDKKLPAKIVGTDERTDVAVLQVEAENIPSITMGDSDELDVGEMVLAIGSPMSEDLAHTVTMGIVSARGRTIKGLSVYQDFIQTDAAINRGNSGGPLINLNGELVGINTAIASQTGGYQGIGFAIPINMARNVMNSLIEHGEVRRAYLGIRGEDMEKPMAEAFGMDRPRGVVVHNVEDGTPADEAGLKDGDVILELNGNKVKNWRLFASRIASNPPGTEITLTILRDNEEKKVEVELGKRPDDLAAEGGAGGESSLEQELGYAVESLDEDLAQQYDIQVQSGGVVVTNIDRRSPAYQQGLREGDLIISVQRQRIRSKSDYEAIMKKLLESGEQTALLRVIRDGEGYFVAFNIN